MDDSCRRGDADARRDCERNEANRSGRTSFGAAGVGNVARWAHAARGLNMNELLIVRLAEPGHPGVVRRGHEAVGTKRHKSPDAHLEAEMLTLGDMAALLEGATKRTRQDRTGAATKAPARPGRRRSSMTALCRPCCLSRP